MLCGISWIYTHTYACLYLYVYVCMCIYIYIHMFFIYAYVCVYIYIYAYVFFLMHVCIYKIIYNIQIKPTHGMGLSEKGIGTVYPIGVAFINHQSCSKMAGKVGVIAGNMFDHILHKPRISIKKKSPRNGL